MIAIDNAQTVGWEHAIRGMRNPLRSWANSDSGHCHQFNVDERGCDDRCVCDGRLIDYCVGDKDKELMLKLVKAGTDHSKFMRYIVVYCDITAPDYFFKEFSTYRVGVTENSTSTMHTIASRHLDMYEDFSTDNLTTSAKGCLADIVEYINYNIDRLKESNDKKYFDIITRLLPMNYNYTRTVVMNYQVLRNMYHSRKNHKLNEWKDFCTWIESLPHSELITEV